MINHDFRRPLEEPRRSLEQAKQHILDAEVATQHWDERRDQMEDVIQPKLSEWIAMQHSTTPQIDLGRFNEELLKLQLVRFTVFDVRVRHTRFLNVTLTAEVRLLKAKEYLLHLGDLLMIQLRAMPGRMRRAARWCWIQGCAAARRTWVWAKPHLVTAGQWLKAQAIQLRNRIAARWATRRRSDDQS